MTHSDIIDMASEWVTINFPVVAMLREPQGEHLREIPDLWCLLRDGTTCMLEAKLSRADASANVNKPHAANGKGCGTLRWLACPPGILNVGAVKLTDFGLLVVSDAGVSEVLPAPRRHIDLHADLYLASIWAGKHRPDAAKTRRPEGKPHPVAGMVLGYLYAHADDQCPTGGTYASDIIKGADLPMTVGTIKKMADELADAARKGHIPGVGVENRGGRPWLFLVRDATAIPITDALSPDSMKET